ncbi:MAG TPA: hypothetical protein VGC11_00015 [Acidimicrobiia bacterium]|jgi:hypothetical protein
MSDERPSARRYVNNWRNSDLPVWEKALLVAKNNAIKVATFSDCCGNHGEPGC